MTQPARQTDPDVREIASARIKQVRPGLEVARVLGRLAIDDARIGIGDEEGGCAGLHIARNHLLHRPRVFVITNGILEDVARVPDGQWLVVGEEISAVGKIEFGDFVVTAVDGIVRTLEQTVFAVVHEFHPGQLLRLRVEQPLDKRARHHGRRRDVVLHLDLGRRIEIFAQPEGAPRVLRIEADAQEIGHQFAAVETQFVGRETVHGVHAEILTPVVSPFRAVKALEHKDQLFDVLRDGFEPCVVFRTERRRRRKEFDDRAERTIRAQDRAIVVAVARRIGVAVRVIPPDKSLDVVEVRLEVRHEDRSGENRIGYGLGDFRFAPAGNRAGFVAQGAFGHRADEAPCAASRRLFHVDLVAAGKDVTVIETERNLAGRTGLLPRHLLGQQLEAGVFGDIDDVRVMTVHRVAFSMQLGGITEQLHGLPETPWHLEGEVRRGDLLGQVVARKNERAPGMLFLGIAEKVGRHTELGFDLLLAIAEVVVRNDGDNDAPFVARGDLERRAVVVGLVRRFPAHAIAALALGGLVP